MELVKQLELAIKLGKGKGFDGFSRERAHGIVNFCRYE